MILRFYKFQSLIEAQFLVLLIQIVTSLLILLSNLNIDAFISIFQRSIYKWTYTYYEYFLYIRWSVVFEDRLADSVLVWNANISDLDMKEHALENILEGSFISLFSDIIS